MNFKTQCIFADKDWEDLPNRTELIEHMANVHQGYSLEYMDDTELYKYLNMRPMFNAFRETYDTLSFEEIKQYYNTIHRLHPLQRRFNPLMWIALFNSFPEFRMDVIELGGYNGELFSHIAGYCCAEIATWVNYELSDVRPSQFHNIDIPFVQHTLDNFLWEYTQHDMYLDFGNVFVASHVLEHISWKQLVKLTEKIISKMDVVLLEIPLPKDPNVRADWHDYPGFHVLDCSWNDIWVLLDSYGFEMTLYSDSGHLIGVKK